MTKSVNMNVHRAWILNSFIGLSAFDSFTARLKRMGEESDKRTCYENGA